MLRFATIVLIQSACRYGYWSRKLAVWPGMHGCLAQYLCIYLCVYVCVYTSDTHTHTHMQAKGHTCGLALVGQPINTASSGWVVSRDAPCILGSVTFAMQELLASGEGRKLVQKWLSPKQCTGEAEVGEQSSTLTVVDMAGALILTSCATCLSFLPSLVMRFWPRSSPQAGSGAEAEAACPDHGDCACEDGEDDLKPDLTEKQMLKMLLKEVAFLKEMKSRDAEPAVVAFS